MTEEAILFIEIFQPFALYRNPFTFYYAQSFPLPPKSAIIGMLQNACNDWYGHIQGIETWWELKIAIFGGFESSFWNYQHSIRGEVYIDKERNMLVNKQASKNKPIPLYGYGQTAQRTPIYVQELFNGHLFIFIKAGKKGKKEQLMLIKEIAESLEKTKKVLSLGRGEDIAYIRSVNFVESVEKEIIEGDIKLHYPTFITRTNFPIKNLKFPVFFVTTKVIFENNGQPVESKKQITKETYRRAEFKEVIYISPDHSLILQSPIEVEFCDINLDKKLETFPIVNDFGWL